MRDRMDGLTDGGMNEWKVQRIIEWLPVPSNNGMKEWANEWMDKREHESMTE